MQKYQIKELGKHQRSSGEGDYHDNVHSTVSNVVSQSC